MNKLHSQYKTVRYAYYPSFFKKDIHSDQLAEGLLFECFMEHINPSKHGEVIEGETVSLINYFNFVTNLPSTDHYYIHKKFANHYRNIITGKTLMEILI